MDALDYMIEAATLHPELTIEALPECVRVSGAVGGALGAKRISWMVMRQAKLNPLLVIIEELRGQLEALSDRQPPGDFHG